ncbi:MAG: hypothetical protein R6W91_01910 [Thermoplasmata archaeon]
MDEGELGNVAGSRNKLIAGIIVAVIVIAGLGVAFVFINDNNGVTSLAPHMSQIVVDMNNNIHVLWSNWASDIYYSKLNTTGNILIASKIIIQGGGELLFSPFIDNETSTIHVISECGLTTLDLNGNVLSENSNVTMPIPGQPIISDSSGQLHYLWQNGTVDSNNTIHTIWFERYSQDSEEIHKTYYKKMDYKGTILVDNQIANISINGKILVDNENNIHILYLGGNSIYYAKLNNQGEFLIDFSKIETTIETTFRVEYFDVSASTNSIGITCTGYSDDGWGCRTYYLALDFDGNVIVVERAVSELSSCWPSISMDSQSNAHIVFETYYTKDCPIYYLKLDQEGNSLVEEVKIFG